MGWFKKKQQPVSTILPENAKCCRCGRKIKKQDEFVYIEGKKYCEKCYRAKRDWDFLAFHALLDD